MQRTNSLEKILMLGKIEGRRRRAQEGFLGGPTVRDLLTNAGDTGSGEDPTLCGMAKLTRGHSWAGARDPLRSSFWNPEPLHDNKEPGRSAGESPHSAMEPQHSHEQINKI